MSLADEFVVKDEAEFRKIVPADARMQKLAGDFRFVEGPQWFADEAGGYLIFSDIPSNRLIKWTAKTGISTFRQPSNNANGNTRDLDGRLITCEHATRRVTRTGKVGSVTPLAERYDAKRLNSPNDVIVKSDGTIWFTDPPYGLPKQTEGKELDKQHVFRLDPKTGKLDAVIADMDRPNGLCFSPDEKKLYVADSGAAKNVRVFDVNPDGTVTGGKVFCSIDVGVPDGMRCDRDGRLWSSAGDGVHIFSPDGKLIGKILTPQVKDPKTGKT